MSVQVEGKTVQVGDYVCFKRDYERYGQIVKITGQNLVVEYEDEYDNELRYTVPAADCWIE